MSKFWFFLFLISFVAAGFFGYSYMDANTAADRAKSSYRILEETTNSAVSNYNKLNTQYKNLTDLYTKLTADYTKLQLDHQKTVTDYNNLVNEYNKLLIK